MTDIYGNAKVYINGEEIEGVEVKEISTTNIEPKTRESRRIRWSRGFRITGTATVTPSWEGMTEADKRKVKRAVKKIKGIKKHRKRVLNRKKLHNKRGVKK
ncbi:hypothetical protein EUAN_07100 [Andreesenia angusta]|uniref:Uncharacterized protein n=1 Tax=Andreesenia angusta TaxID=39480 RepID=A0A1S1V8K6_9FIRM|nr:hypothetical protein [Andreesenia angusta]OHW62926.1 hypothetical protein EUAN_07100 [Andreesenia angusta]